MLIISPFFYIGKQAASYRPQAQGLPFRLPLQE